MIDAAQLPYMLHLLLYLHFTFFYIYFSWDFFFFFFKDGAQVALPKETNQVNFAGHLNSLDGGALETQTGLGSEIMICLIQFSITFFNLTWQWQ